MALETFNYIDSLNTANPTATDNVSEGDDHIRGIKTTLKNTFPNVNAEVSPTDEELNYVDGVTSAIQTQLDAKISTADDSVTIAQLSATGTASSSTFLRGDNSWVVPTDTNTDTKWDGGTTGLTAATGRTSLGLVIGTDVQAYSANTAITTADTSWTGSQRATLVVDNDGSFDMNGGNNFKCTPAGTFALTFTNITDGQSGFILFINTGGHTITKPSTTKVDANLLATVTAAGTYLISYLSDGTNVYLTNSAIYT